MIKVYYQPRFRNAEDKEIVHEYPTGKATLVDGGGRLMVLDSANMPVAADGDKVSLAREIAWSVKHTLAAFSVDEWSRTERS